MIVLIVLGIAVVFLIFWAACRVSGRRSNEDTRFE